MSPRSRRGIAEASDRMGLPGTRSPNSKREEAQRRSWRNPAPSPPEGPHRICARGVSRPANPVSKGCRLHTREADPPACPNTRAPPEAGCEALPSIRLNDACMKEARMMDRVEGDLGSSDRFVYVVVVCVPTKWILAPILPPMSQHTCT